MYFIRSHLIFSSTLFILLIMIGFDAYGQRETDHWLFGMSAGLHFSKMKPTGLRNNNLKAIEGSASVSDKDTGQLLFYTDGRNFWSANHTLMPSSDKPYACATRITQSAIIVPDNRSHDLYHVFCIQPMPELVQGAGVNCFYSTTETITEGLALLHYQVDMRLNGGLGDIVTSATTLLRSDVTEKLTAIKHKNNEDFWIVTHGWGNNNFYVYPLTSAGILPPVVTSLGSIHWAYEIYQELSGEMKASPDGTKIACAVGLSERPFDLFDFDASTGVLSNYQNLGNVMGQYGVSFSPDNSKLYVSSDGKEPHSSDRSIILQFDLTGGSVERIKQSRMSIIAQNPKTNIPPSGVFDGFRKVWHLV